MTPKPETAMTRDEAIELLLMHAVACSEYLFQGLVSQKVRDTIEPRARAIMNQYGADLVKRTIEAFEVLAAPLVHLESDYEKDMGVWVDADAGREAPNG